MKNLRHGSPLHQWDVSAAEARELQRRLASRIIASGGPASVRTVAGVDVAAGRSAGSGRAAIVVLSYPGLAEVERSTVELPLPFPYVPGLLSFREAPLVLAAYDRLTVRPDLLLVDGQGIAHPRRFGLASHLGLWLDLPSVGCAKSRLVGEYDQPGEAAGATAPLIDGGERIGAVVRTRAATRPLFVSPGHLIGIDEAVAWTLACCRGRRLPEPTRLADMVSKGKA